MKYVSVFYNCDQMSQDLYHYDGVAVVTIEEFGAKQTLIPFEFNECPTYGVFIDKIDSKIESVMGDGFMDGFVSRHYGCLQLSLK